MVVIIGAEVPVVVMMIIGAKESVMVVVVIIILRHLDLRLGRLGIALLEKRVTCLEQRNGIRDRFEQIVVGLRSHRVRQMMGYRGLGRIKRGEG